MSLGVVLLTTCAVPCEQVTAQSQDLLQEKLNFLKRKLQTHLTHSVREGEGREIGNVSFEAVSFATCRVAWSILSEVSPNPDTPAALSDFKISNQVSVDLSSIDAARTRIYVVEQMARRNMAGSLVLELRIRPASPGFKQQMVTTKSGRVTRIPTMEAKEYSFFFNTRDRVVAEDISKAFADASSLCRPRMQRRG